MLPDDQRRQGKPAVRVGHDERVAIHELGFDSVLDCLSFGVRFIKRHLPSKRVIKVADDRLRLGHVNRGGIDEEEAGFRLRRGVSNLASLVPSQVRILEGSGDGGIQRVSIMTKFNSAIGRHDLGLGAKFRDRSEKRRTCAASLPVQQQG